jgi:Arc/MetJ-type ribon-helix-helix transcriptional regulator
MVKDTVRYPDVVVEEIERRVEDTSFESKSEFYRFSAELTLSLIDPGYEAEMFHFRELQDELGIELEASALEAAGGESAMLEALIAVRKHSLRGEFEEAEAYIEENFVDIDRETMILEEVLSMYRERSSED